MIKSELTKKLNRALEHLEEELKKIRTGRATPALIEDLKVEAYDSMMVIKELGSIQVTDAKTLLISPWNKDLLKNISKAIETADLGLNPSIDGTVVRVPIPSLTEDRRKELTKLVSEKVEDAKQSIRNIRQDTMKEIDKDFKDKLMGEDEKFRQVDIVEDEIKKFTEKAISLGDEKEQDILNI